MSTFIRSISGIRGIVGDGLSPEEIVTYAAAFAQYCGGKPIVVGTDGRPSGAAIKKIVCGTLQACGVDVIDLGMVPTPTVQMKVENSPAGGGIAITASHNPAQWNGLKFLAGTGIFLDADQNAKLFEIADAKRPHYVLWDRMGVVTLDEDYIYQHIDSVLSIPFLDLEKIRERRFKIVVDAVNASGSVIAEELLNELNCEVIPAACDGTGLFPHTPEPLPENLASLGEAVRTVNADMGFAIDPDADRLVLFNENGEPYGEEYTITTAVDSVLSSIGGSQKGPVVVNLSTTRAVEDVAARYGAECLRTPVGEINVVKRMLESKALIGGEGSGGVILPSVHAGRDSLVGIALVLNAFAKHGGTVSEYKAGLPQYEIRKLKYSVEGLDPDGILERAREIYADEKLNTDDGVRIDFAEGWVHLRKSNTEPIIRAIAEAQTGDAALALAERVTSSVMEKG